MVETRGRVYQGPWRRLVNSAAASAGSIHDDAAARASGFEGGFVPGSTVGTLALTAAFDRYGPRWMEGGWYSLTFVSPVYVHNDVRAEGEPVEGSVDLSVRVVTDEGRLCCSGRAGLGDAAPWERAAAGSREGPEVLPGVPVGLELEPVEFTLTEDDARTLADAAGDDGDWYRERSPWGGAVVPPERLMVVALRMRPAERLIYEGVRQPGMWAKHELALRRPLFLGTGYTMRNRIVDKGRSGRTIFLTYEFEVDDGDGERVAVGRHGVKWLVARETDEEGRER